MDRRSAASTPPRLLAAAAWALAVGGLFAMHGLGLHGTTAQHGGDVMRSSHVAVDDQFGSMPSLTEHQSPDTVVGDREVAFVEPSRPTVPAHPAVMLTCVAVLVVAAGAVVILLLPGRRAARPLMLLPRQLGVVSLVGRDRSPPPRGCLSVMRC